MRDACVVAGSPPERILTGLSMLAIGVLLGMKHATDADHLAAVATLATREASVRQTVRQGIAWGCGHAITLMLFGGIVIGLGRSIPPQMEQMLELAVGVMLIVLGAGVLYRLRRQRIHFHVHAHGRRMVHIHAHSHAADVSHSHSTHRHTHAGIGAMAARPASRIRHAPFGDEHDGAEGLDARAFAQPKATMPYRAFSVGVMHGMAGSAALIVLSLEAAPSVTMAIAYVALFGAGSILGMALLSVAIAIPMKLSATRFTFVHNGINGVVGVISCALGGWIVYQVSAGGLIQRLLAT